MSRWRVGGLTIALKKARVPPPECPQAIGPEVVWAQSVGGVDGGGGHASHVCDSVSSLLHNTWSAERFVKAALRGAE